MCFGTHALISQGVHFMNLGLVITDEQHRFGVAQRAKLRRKGRCAHTLVMSATPIPRTLALMIYGELDISVIDELPPGRSPVLTYKISSGKRERAFGFIRKHLDRGLQAYIVCPRVEAGEEDMGLHAATEYMMDLSSGAFTGYTVGLLHGRMKASEKERVMESFQRGEIQLLVSTTVVEVGVDVPNAVIMMIENAERFGLSQLHQLRGRVGRGKEQSYCILLSDSRSEETVERLKIMCKTSDGFAIAEYDLKTRGPGNFLGQEQHGLPRLRIADLVTDADTVTQARESAEYILAADPTLCAPEHAALRAAVERMMDSVGGRQNLSEKGRNTNARFCVTALFSGFAMVSLHGRQNFFFTLRQTFCLRRSQLKFFAEAFFQKGWKVFRRSLFFKKAGRQECLRRVWSGKYRKRRARS